MTGRYVKAIHDFDSSTRGDLPLKIHDIVKVTNVIDLNWLTGECHGKSGNFPQNYVQPIELPAIGSGEWLFAAIGKFTGEEPGDLGFQKGDIVVGTSAVDDNWWNGRLDGRSGIFPLTHVERLPSPAIPLGVSAGVIAEGRTNSSLTAQLEGELSFSEGDLVQILRIIDDGFAIGRCCGCVGQFPLSFVDITKGCVVNSAPSAVPCAKFDWWKDGGVQSKVAPVAAGYSPSDAENSPVGKHLADNSEVAQKRVCLRSSMGSRDSLVTPYAKTLFPFRGKSAAELSFGKYEIVTLVRHVDDAWTEGEIDGKKGIFPTNYVQIIVDCHQFYDGGKPLKLLSESANPAQKLSSLDNALTETYARVLYDFSGNASNDLSVREGDTITVLQQVDAHWLEARHDDGRVGLCPITYVEVFGSEPTRQDRLSPVHSSRSPAHNQSSPLKAAGAGRGKPEVKPKPAKMQSTNAGGVTVRSLSHDVIATQKVSADSGVRPHSEIAAVNSLSNNVTTSNALPRPQSNGSLPRTPVQRQNNIEKTLDLDDLVRNQLLAAKKSGGLSLTKDPVASRGTPLNAIRNFTETTTADSHCSSGGFRKAASVSDQSSAAGLNLDLDLDWLVNRSELVSVDGGSRGGSGATTPIKKKPAPSRPAVPMPPTSQSRSHWQVFEDERRSGAGLSGMGSSGAALSVAPPRHGAAAPGRGSAATLPRVSETSGQNLMDFSPEQGAKRSSVDMEMLSRLSPLRGSIAGVGSMNPPTGGSMNPPRGGSMNPSPGQSEGSQLSSAAAKLKRRETREKVIQELLTTEESFASSLELCMKSFHSTERCPATLDIDVMLGNALDVMELSQSISSTLHADARQKTFEEQLIGRCFVTLKEDILRVYALYCQNHDSVIALMKKYEHQPDVTDYFARVIDNMRKQVPVFDMSSVLIKPVQRVLKYPLLLNELDKATEMDHIDKKELQRAIVAMTDVASTVNEFKRRKELVQKYKHEAERTLGDKLGRLSVHSTKKKFFRMSQMMHGPQTVDENFNREEQRFKALDSALRTLTKDMSQYIEHFQESMNLHQLVALGTVEYYAEQQSQFEIDKFCRVHSKLIQQHFAEFIVEVESDIFPPLNSLLLMFQGPQKVIRKRYDKLLDYDNASMRQKSVTDSDQIKSSNEELQSMRRTYEALNAQLRDDLPRLFTLSTDIIRACLARFISLQSRLHRKILDEMLNLLGLQLISSPSASGNIVESFNIAHAIAVERLSDMSFTPHSFNPQAEELRRFREQRRSIASATPGLPTLVDVSVDTQSSGQKAYLRHKYGADKLFVVSRDYAGVGPMDLTLPEGALVGVVKEGDPMGNSNKWFVDDGSGKGFISKDHLTPQKRGGPIDLLTTDLLGLLDPPLVPAMTPALAPGLSPALALTPKLSLAMAPAMSPTPALTPTLSPARSSSASLGSFDDAVYDRTVHDLVNDEKPRPHSATTSGPMAAADNSGSVQWAQFSLDEKPAHEKAKSSDLQEQFSQEPLEDMYCQAGFAFSARGGMEVSVVEGEVVKVIQQYDLEGNAEWWLVEKSDGTSGYAPANYLYAMT